MAIESNQVVCIRFKLMDDDGRVLGGTTDPLTLSYIQGAGQVLIGLEEGLEGRAVGERLRLILPAERAYGAKDQGLLVEAQRGQFEGDGIIEPGMQFRSGSGPDSRLFVVTGVRGDKVLLDGNHPLAGLTLHFDIEILGIRDATPEELAQGVPQGPQGLGVTASG